jgi:hypothetical protein
MTVSETSGDISRLKRTPWRFQETIDMSSGNGAEEFVSTILDSGTDSQEAAVTISEIVFDSTKMDALLAATPGFKLTRHCSVTAKGQLEIGLLLNAAFEDGNDFVVFLKPKPFVIYSDHHWLTTFFANTKSNLNSVITPLVLRGFKSAPDFQREL